MKNKSKLNRIRQSNKKNTPQVPKEWLYLCPSEISVSDVARALEGEEISVQVWNEAGVAEIEIPEAKSIDFEATKLDLKDEFSNAFLAEHHTKSLFYVTIDPENYSRVEQILRLILTKLGGIFCGDTEDFTPMIRG